MWGSLRGEGFNPKVALNRAGGRCIDNFMHEGECTLEYKVVHCWDIVLCENLLSVVGVFACFFVVKIISKTRNKCANCAFLGCE